MIFFIKNAIISILISVESESLCDIQSVQKFAFELQSTVAKTWSTSFSFLLLLLLLFLLLLLLLPPILTNICQKYPWSITICTTFLILFHTLTYTQRSSNGTRKKLVILFCDPLKTRLSNLSSRSRFSTGEPVCQPTRVLLRGDSPADISR